ncbi:MAG: tetratricopeptide repeat protein [Chloroflexota bacterium]
MATLQEAINATRSGNNIEAQKILADILKTDTDNTQAWYLLALLVDSPEKKEAYLNRVLALDPDHEKAKEALANAVMPATSSMTLEPESVIEQDTAVSPTATFEDPSDFSSDTIDSSLPSWLEADNPNVSEDMLVEEEPSEIFNSELPDWLSSESSALDVLDEPPTVPSAVTPKEISEAISLDDDLDLSLEPEEGSLTDLSEEIDQSLPQSDPAPSTLEHTAEPSKPSLLGWNLALAILSLLALLTLVALVTQLFNFL